MSLCNNILILRQTPPRIEKIIELVNVPDGNESEDDLNIYESKEEGVPPSVSNSSAASTSSSVSATQNPTGFRIPVVDCVSQPVIIDIDSIFDREDALPPVMKNP